MEKNKKTILVVEDEKTLREVLVEKIKNEGFDVLDAKDGEEGLKKAIENQPDLILLDIIMPKMDGITMFGKLKEDEKGKDIPVIILTNLSPIEGVSQTIDRDVNNYLVKSDWKLEEVMEQIRNTLNMN
ncbi:MAG: response regulator [Candidatus Moranbacteria bacterium]|nr:response regulator [Candidatus Moranbacteria bacterium]